VALECELLFTALSSWSCHVLCLFLHLAESTAGSRLRQKLGLIILKSLKMIMEFVSNIRLGTLIISVALEVDIVLQRC